jgi:23S rRNA (guanine745-N1)-methyltransferase
VRLPLACTVRGCRLPLQPQARQYVCPRGHTFDIARSGYLNLLQPQDRRSSAAGDRRTSIEARARLLAAGVGRTMLDEAIGRATALDLRPEAVVVDLGAGSGEALAALAERRAIAGIGIDLAPAAAEHAARRFPSLTWVVANADRRLPLVDGSVDLALSIHGRRNPEECQRVLMPQGHLLVSAPAEDDLIELRALLLGEATRRDRTDAIRREHMAGFALLERQTAREQHVLTREQVRDLLQGTYRGARAREANRADTLDCLKVTMASEILLFRRHGDATASRGRS